MNEENDDYEIEDSQMDEKMYQKNATKQEELNENDAYYTGLLPLLKNIQDSLVKTTQSGTTSKINFLENIRDNLLFNISNWMFYK